MGPDDDTAVAAYVGDCQAGADRWGPGGGQFVGGGNGFARALQSCVHFGGIAFALRGGAPFVVANGFGEVVAAGESGPFGPLGSGRDGIRGADRFPFIGRKDGDEIALGDDLRGRVLLFVERADGAQGGAHSGWTPT